MLSCSDSGSGWISHKGLVDQFYSSQLAITVETWFSRGIHHPYREGMGSVIEILWITYSTTEMLILFICFFKGKQK